MIQFKIASWKLSQLTSIKQSTLQNLQKEIQLQIDLIQSLQAQNNSTEEADLLISRFKAQKLPGLLPSYQVLQHP
jgi:hypothetical protein